MAKNLMCEICKMLGVELGEEFKIKEYGERIYRFANSGLQLIYDNGVRNLNITTNMALSGLLSGDLEIVKLQWKPKNGDVYYTFVRAGIDCACTPISYQWDGGVIDIALFKVGWVFKTEKEAKAALPAVARAMGVSYKL